MALHPNRDNLTFIFYYKFLLSVFPAFSSYVVSYPTLNYIIRNILYHFNTVGKGERTTVWSPPKTDLMFIDFFWFSNKISIFMSKNKSRLINIDVYFGTTFQSDSFYANMNSLMINDRRWVDRTEWPFKRSKSFLHRKLRRIQKKNLNLTLIVTFGGQ